MAGSGASLIGPPATPHVGGLQLQIESAIAMLDAKSLLNSLLSEGKAMTGQGKDLATRSLGVPAGQQSQDTLMKGLGAGAIGGTVLGLLLGSKGGRKMGGQALKVGSVAALGLLAYKAYQNYSQTKAGGAPGAAAGAAPPVDTASDGALLLKAMIAAANADGHIDAEERLRILRELEKVGIAGSAMAALDAEIAQPLDAVGLARLVPNDQAAAEVYALSVAVIDEVSAAERAYLDRLALALRLPEGLAQQLEQEVSRV
jgi:uncharacterized membrane protein YebE (DUF533 family)